MLLYIYTNTCCKSTDPPKKTQTLNKVKVSKIIYQKIKDLENIKKK